MADKLNARQLEFVKRYVAHHNGYRAAIEAGYAEGGADSQAARLLADARVQTQIAELDANIADELGLTKQQLLTDLYLTFQKAFEGAPKVDRDGDITFYDDPTTGERKMVMEWSPSGAVRALELLMKHRGMLADRAELHVSGDIVYTLDLGNDLEPEGGDSGSDTE